MDYDILKKLVDQGYSQHQIAQQTGKSQTTIRYWLRKLGLKTTYGRGGKLLAPRCKRCGEQDPNKMMRNGKSGYAKSICRACQNRNTIERGRRNKRLYLEYMGGKCQLCGYSKCPEALEFHHTDPTQKDPTFRSIRYWGLEKAKKELDQCMLVCANCHREIHWGVS